MEKTLFAELVTIYDWSYALKNGAAEQVDPQELAKRLSCMEQILQRLYIVRVKESDFGKLFQKFRKTVLWLIHTLGDFEGREGDGGVLGKVLALVEDFLEQVDLRFAGYLQAEDALSPRQVDSVLLEMRTFPNLDHSLILSRSADSLALLRTIFQTTLRESPSYGTLIEIERTKFEFLSQLNCCCEHPFFSAVDSALILMGFSSERYLGHLYDKLNQGMKSAKRSQGAAQVVTLRQYLKILEELSCAVGRRENVAIRFLRSMLDDCLENGSLSLSTEAVMSMPQALDLEQDKITCNLSGDQLALIIRAMDDSRLLNAKSMNAVFRRIVPYLSTACRKNLSYQAVRSKSYSPEESDREASLRALEKMIEKIKSY